MEKRRVKRKCIYPMLDKWMRNNNISVKQLAKQIYVSEGTLYDYLKGRYAVSLNVKQRLSEITDIAIKELFQKDTG